METIRCFTKTGCNDIITPVLKWAGGKTQLLKQIIPLLPIEGVSSYCEPFIGGGALLFYIKPKIAFINDINSNLINVYNVIKYYPENLIIELSKYENTAEFYSKIREIDRNNEVTLSNIQAASRFIYLNKTCFNGLYRENSKGQFNVPYGKYKNPNFINSNGIYSMSKYFNESNVVFTSTDFQMVLENIPYGTFVYLYPPYDPLSKTSNFTNYTKYGFNKIDQTRLRDCCNILTERGIKFMLSNSDTDFIRNLYKGYNITELFAKRSINCNKNNRKHISELIIRNYV